MAIRIVRLGTPRAADEGVRLGTVRRPPRGVRREDYGRRDYYDVWLPELAPSAKVVAAALSKPWTPARWRRFERQYRREMREPTPRHVIEMLAALSHVARFSVGCYCEDESRCHRRILRRLLEDAGADVAIATPGRNAQVGARDDASG